MIPGIIMGFVSAYVIEGLILWWGWKYSEREDKKRMSERLDPRFGRERFDTPNR
jgi:hypothetical protein